MLNKIDLMGRFTAEPELRQTTTGKSVVRFTLAVDRDFSDKETDFITCVAWNSTADFIAKYFHKGNMAVVSGSLQMRNWEDKTGNKRTSAEVLLSNIYFGQAKAAAEPAATATPKFVDADEEDLPF